MIDSRLTILGPDYTRGRNSYVKCLCTCGNIKTIRRDHVVSGEIKSCGCLERELIDQARLERSERIRLKGVEHAETKARNRAEMETRKLKPGFRHPGHCSLTSQVASVIRRIGSRLSSAEIADFFNIDRHSVRDILNGNHHQAVEYFNGSSILADVLAVVEQERRTRYSHVTYTGNPEDKWTCKQWKLHVEVRMQEEYDRSVQAAGMTTAA